MTAPHVLRQASALVHVLAEHLVGDPVFFGMQVSRRLPRRCTELAGRVIQRFPQLSARAAGAWLIGDHDGARDAVRTCTGRVSGRSARVLGELALHLGMRDEAITFAADAGTSAHADSLRARIAWHDGEMSAAIDAASDQRLRRRLAAERTVFTPGWVPVAPTVPAPKAAQRAVGRSRTDIVFALTNSLPHTQSGYTLRTHAVLRALRETGLSSVGVTRTGYPVSVGRMSWSDQDVVDDVAYQRDIPWRQGKLLTERLTSQAQFLTEVAVTSRARALHTTTHFVNGTATRAAAEALELPWVYEVRGVLEETWAASRGSAAGMRRAHDSERFRLFREREIETALAADRVVTLGHTMAAELARRGVSREKILVAPNGVSEHVLTADVTRPPSEVRGELGLPSGGTWVGTAASIVAYEGLDVLVDAVRVARSQGTDLRLLIVGDGVELPQLRARAANLGKAAAFTGRVSHSRAHAMTLGLDVFVVPRRDDPVCQLVTPLKPVEAAGLGRPVVMSDLPALTEALPAHVRRTVSAGAVSALADTLVQLAEDPEARLGLGAAGRDFVREQRTWEEVGSAYAEMYKGLGVAS